jgi:hypothetical protein
MPLDETVRWIEKINIRRIKSADLLPITQIATKMDFNISMSQIVGFVKTDSEIGNSILHPNSNGLSHQQVVDNKTSIQAIYDGCNIGRINRRR